MNVIAHEVGHIRIAEIISDEILINSPEDALQLIMDLHYQDFSKMILYEKNITPAFFDLKTRLAGEVLQKFSNYRAQIAIIGTFTKYPGKSIRDFIYESNKGRQVNFLDSVELAVERWSK